MNCTTVGESLLWSHANLAMAHAAVEAKASNYTRVHYMIRARLFAGLSSGKMQVGALVEDERLKMILPQACCYCGGRQRLAADHLISSKRGGANTGENLVWACTRCNSSKGAADVLEWLASRKQFPPLLLLRRYLKLALDMTIAAKAMDRPRSRPGDLPFSAAAVPLVYPRPEELCLWVTSLK